MVPSNLTQQAYRFQSTLTVLNNGLQELPSWRVFVGFKHNELLVSASNAVLADGTSLPANVSTGAVLAGFPVTNLRTGIQTAGDLNLMLARVELVGTQFGVGSPDIPLPGSLRIANDGFSCTSPSAQGNVTQVCCFKDSNAPPSFELEDQGIFQPPLQNGDISIMYDVMRSYESNYLAQVTISNQNPVSRLDNWHLSWDWMRDEFINTMRGAYPFIVDTNECIYGRQGEFYQDLDFSAALNCERRPVIIDLPLDRTNDTNLGRIPFCCRNGTILPPNMDPTRSTSIFQMQVYKMPPDLNRTQLTPPQNWKINGTNSPNYQCSPPVRTNPTLFPNPEGLSSETAAIASWQVVCNISRWKSESPKCCVSFSSFNNESVIPCNTCACGCKSDPSDMCSATTPALLLPSEALLIPFDNRTKIAKEFSRINNWKMPDPLPCPDNCGVSINWHLLSDFKDGWSARMTVFNWGETDFADWFAAVELDNAVPGFEQAYSFNGTALSGTDQTLFIQGLPGLNYIVAERQGKNPKKDPRVPGSQQSVVSFTKKTTPGINVIRGDGYPSKVYFNGEECSLPSMLPSDGHGMSAATSVLICLIASFVIVLLQL
ncbi:COBRA-like protein 7 [Heracleum sosnowskyi]|uniref:COBRA-like protein 7 n=1 Tax=Heracleum sosnowskyi TaxID=360622 RepID=A0AAD8J7K7_9APIA|nr:COBRA-like protein 7 [Heracleum sosnowskyi]